MGAAKGEVGNPDELPQHPVEITRDFYIGKFEITQAQYAAVTGRGVPELFDVGVRLPAGDDYPM